MVIAHPLPIPAEYELTTREYSWNTPMSEIPDIIENNVMMVPNYLHRTTPLDVRNRLGNGKYSHEDRRPKCVVTYVRADTALGKLILKERASR
jgi:hypothetical protein